MVNVYNNNEVIARVKYTNNLDFWDGRNYTNGGAGLHKGLTKLKDGSFVLIHGSQWQGSKDHAKIITADKALQEILKSDYEELLEEEKFKELKKLNKQMLIEEE